jgi:hypothetical protein
MNLEKDNPHIVLAEPDHLGNQMFVHRQYGKAHSLTIEDYPMVFRNRSVASKVRQKANRELCNGWAMEKLFIYQEHESWVEDDGGVL